MLIIAGSSFSYTEDTSSGNNATSNPFKCLGNKKAIMQISTELKKHIVEEIESGVIRLSDAAWIYGIHRTLLSKWLKRYKRLSLRWRSIRVVNGEARETINTWQKILERKRHMVKLHESMLTAGCTNFFSTIETFSEVCLADVS